MSRHNRDRRRRHRPEGTQQTRTRIALLPGAEALTKSGPGLMDYLTPYAERLFQAIVDAGGGAGAVGLVYNGHRLMLYGRTRNRDDGGIGHVSLDAAGMAVVEYPPLLMAVTEADLDHPRMPGDVRNEMRIYWYGTATRPSVFSA